MTTLAHMLDRKLALGLAVLVAVMPFHAFLSVWLGHLVGHETVIQAWKEALTVILVIVAGVLVALDRSRLRPLLRPMNYLIVVFGLVAVVVTLAARPGWPPAAYGLKTDLEFLVLFVIAQLAAGRVLSGRLVRIVIATSLVVAVIGVLLTTVLPHDTLAHFGYGPTTVAPYQLVDGATMAVRTPSTLGGPNQFGSFLILPLCLVAAFGLAKRQWRYAGMFLVLNLGLVVTYSRSAWLGAAVGLLVVLFLTLRAQMAAGVAAVAGLMALGAVAVAVWLGGGGRVRDLVLHAEDNASFAHDSTAQHAASLQHGVQLSLDHPLGLGLGAAGPASFHSAAAVIPENYYLQVAVETGWLGLVAFAGIVGSLAAELWLRRDSVVAAALLAALAGNSIVNLFLHGWADSSTAFVFWILAGVVVGQRR